MLCDKLENIIVNCQQCNNSVLYFLLLKQASSKTVHADAKKQHSGKHGASYTPPRKGVKRAKLYCATTSSDEEFEVSDTSTSSEW